ncbi:MAG: TonB-dependent receptor, partial [Acidobacteriota bacterium]
MRWGKVAPFIVVLLLTCGGLWAQSTRGDIQGRVTDKNGAALPGVSASLESPALQGKLTTVTDSNGAFKFLRLSPGIYTATFSLVGYQTHQQSNIKVGIDTTARFEVVMAEAFSSEIVVTSESPLVNTRETTVGAELSQDFFIDLPIDRNYTSVAAVTPGAQDDGSGQTFYGSTGAENAYYIDGVNTTDVEYGQQGTVLNFEFIDEVQVKAGGYTAEYGHATGGLINVITKSGGNEFHGDVFGYFD